MLFFFLFFLFFFFFFFFFSSRRRHTRFDCDWSSDVCSSDLNSPRARHPQKPAGHSNAAWPTSSTARSSKINKRSEEHTSELQSQSNLVCRLLLEKKKKTNKHTTQFKQHHQAIDRAVA